MWRMTLYNNDDSKFVTEEENWRDAEQFIFYAIDDLEAETITGFTISKVKG